MKITEDNIKEIIEKLQKDYNEVVEKYDKAVDIIYSQPNPDVGTTPKDLVYKERRVKLYRYKPVKSEQHPVPLLIINSLINGYYILDLMPDFSLVNFLVNEGFDVFSIQWDKPKESEKNISFDYHITGYIKNCINKIKSLTKKEKINIMGYCMGGNLGMVYTSLYPEDINAFINLAAPIDFSKGGVLKKWADIETIDIKKFIKTIGNVPTYIMDMVFPFIKPSERIKATSYLLKNPDNNFYARLYKAMLQWREDNSFLPASFAKKFLIDFYKENKLINGKLKINKKSIDIKNIKCPVLNIIAKNDYIVPKESSLPLLDLISSVDKETVYVDGGHLDIILNLIIRQTVWNQIKEWLYKHSQ